MRELLCCASYVVHALAGGHPSLGRNVTPQLGGGVNEDTYTKYLLRSFDFDKVLFYVLPKVQETAWILGSSL